MIEELVPGERLFDMSQEALQEAELAPAEVDAAALHRHLARHDIERDDARLQSFGREGRSSPGERADSSRKLGVGERFHEVVVGARVQAGDTILDGVAGREHQDRSCAAGPSNLPGDIETRTVRQPHVKDDQLDAGQLREVTGFRGRRSGFDHVAVLAEQALQQAAHSGIVFDQQQVHRASMAPRRRQRLSIRTDMETRWPHYGDHRALEVGTRTGVDG